MRLQAHQGSDSSLDALGRSALDLIRATRDRVEFQTDLQTGRSRVWRAGGGDQPGILRSHIGDLCDKDDPPEHSIRSLLAVSLNGRHSVYMALDCLRHHSHSKIETGEFLNATELNPLIGRSPILDGRAFVELSFEIPVDDDATARLLSTLCRSATEIGAPIGHLHLPSTPQEGTRLRMGVGLDAGNDSLHLGTLSTMHQIACDFDVGLKAFTKLVDRWTELRPDRGEPHRAVVQGGGWQVQLVAEARIGLLASVIARFSDAGLPVEHGTMLVIEGCTVATLGGGSSIGRDGLASVIQRLSNSDGVMDVAEIPREPLGDAQSGAQFAGAVVEGDPVWVGWRCDNRAGGLASLLDLFEQLFGHGYNITYVASRAVEGGRKNAGRLRAVPTNLLSLDERHKAATEISPVNLPPGLMIDLRSDEISLVHRTEPIRLS